MTGAVRNGAVKRIESPGVAVHVDANLPESAGEVPIAMAFRKVIRQDQRNNVGKITGSSHSG